MSYNPAIPQPTNLISVSQGAILENFFQLNAQFLIDHTPFDNGGTNVGFHKQVTQLAPVAASATGTQGILHTVNGAANTTFVGKPVQYFSNSVGDFPIIPNILNTTIAIGSYSGNMYSFKIGTFLVNFAQLICNVSDTQTITYPAGFTFATDLSFYFNYFDVTGPIFASNPTSTNFKVSRSNSGGNGDIRILAVGF